MTLADHEVVVAGARVRLRPFTRVDVDLWQAWPDYEDPLLVGTSPQRMGNDQRSRWHEDLVQRQRQIPFSIDDEHGRFIGRLFLRQVRREEGSAVLGIDLDPANLAQGYGTEALACFLGHFFGPMDFRHMLLSVAAHNERAKRSYTSLGFHYTGSHWDHHPGPDVLRSPSLNAVHHLFRSGPGGLEALFYDMALDREEWLEHNAEVRDRRHA